MHYSIQTESFLLINYLDKLLFFLNLQNSEEKQSLKKNLIFCNSELMNEMEGYFLLQTKQNLEKNEDQVSFYWPKSLNANLLMMEVFDFYKSKFDISFLIKILASKQNYLKKSYKYFFNSGLGGCNFDLSQDFEEVFKIPFLQKEFGSILKKLTKIFLEMKKFFSHFELNHKEKNQLYYFFLKHLELTEMFFFEIFDTNSTQKINDFFKNQKENYFSKFKIETYFGVYIKIFQDKFCCKKDIEIFELEGQNCIFVNLIFFSQEYLNLFENQFENLIIINNLEKDILFKAILSSLKFQKDIFILDLCEHIDQNEIDLFDILIDSQNLSKNEIIDNLNFFMKKFEVLNKNHEKKCLKIENNTALVNSFEEKIFIQNASKNLSRKNSYKNKQRNLKINLNAYDIYNLFYKKNDFFLQKIEIVERPFMFKKKDIFYMAAHLFEKIVDKIISFFYKKDFHHKLNFADLSKKMSQLMSENISYKNDERISKIIHNLVHIPLLDFINFYNLQIVNRFLKNENYQIIYDSFEFKFPIENQNISANLKSSKIFALINFYEKKIIIFNFFYDKKIEKKSLSEFAFRNEIFINCLCLKNLYTDFKIRNEIYVFFNQTEVKKIIFDSDEIYDLLEKFQKKILENFDNIYN